MFQRFQHIDTPFALPFPPSRTTTTFSQQQQHQQQNAPHLNNNRNSGDDEDETIQVHVVAGSSTIDRFSAATQHQFSHRNFSSSQQQQQQQQQKHEKYDFNVVNNNMHEISLMNHDNNNNDDDDDDSTDNNNNNNVNGRNKRKQVRSILWPMGLLFLAFGLTMLLTELFDVYIFPPRQLRQLRQLRTKSTKSSSTTTTFSNNHHHENHEEYQQLIIETFQHLFLPPTNHSISTNNNEQQNFSSKTQQQQQQKLKHFLQNEYNDLLYRSTQYINIVDNPPCNTPVRTPFMTTQKHHSLPYGQSGSHSSRSNHENLFSLFSTITTTTITTPKQSCHVQHTTWDENAQKLVSIQCRSNNNHHIPLYFSPTGDMIFRSPHVIRRHWRLFPSDHVILHLLNRLVLAENLHDGGEKSEKSENREKDVKNLKNNLQNFVSEHLGELLHDLSSRLSIDTSHFAVIQTACVDLDRKLSIHNFFTQVVRNETLVQERREVLKNLSSKNRVVDGDKKSDDDEMNKEYHYYRPPDIHVLLIDGASRDYFYRHFPHTKDYLNGFSANTEQNTNNDKKSDQKTKKKKKKGVQVLDFTNNMVLGYNSIPNMYAFIAGRSVSDDEAVDSKLIRYHEENRAERPFIWDRLKRDFGYVTSVGEDAGNSGIGNIYGIGGRGHMTFDTYPAYHLVSHRVNHDQAFFFNYNARICPCAGQRFMSDIVLDWSRRHLTTYDDLPNFILSASHEVHDTMARQVLTLDRNLQQYVQWFIETKIERDENSVLVLMADHGIHYGPIFANEKQARWEHENPLMLVVAPNRLVTDTLLSNRDKLVTLKDMHMTIRDWASFPVRSTLDGVRPDAKSLLYDSLPSDRSCEDVQSHPSFSTSCHSPRRRRPQQQS